MRKPNSWTSAPALLDGKCGAILLLAHPQASLSIVWTFLGVDDFHTLGFRRDTLLPVPGSKTGGVECATLIIIP